MWLCKIYKFVVIRILKLEFRISTNYYVIAIN